VNPVRKAAILTGDRGTGKTTLCRGLALRVSGAGGIVCPAFFDGDGNKIGFRCVSIVTGESWELGAVSLRNGGHSDAPAGISGSAASIDTQGTSEGSGRAARGRIAPGNTPSSTGKYLFSEIGIQRAIASIRDSLERDDGVTIIDEIGPLELRQGAGFAPALPLLATAGNLIIVVRAELIDELLGFLPSHQHRTFHLTISNREMLEMGIESFFTDPRDLEDPK
jgi:nucleoside-triphosphatase THEP1